MKFILEIRKPRKTVAVSPDRAKIEADIRKRILKLKIKVLPFFN